MKLYNDIYTIIEKRDNAVTIRLLPSSAIYRAHFPGNPVTPGVCQVGIIGELLETVCGRKLTLREVKNLKFVEVLKPDVTEEACITFEKIEDDGERLVVKGTVSSETTVFTKFSLVFETV
jgi:3-hydroxyacyl-[acyl-carrier-protein] dehydratase